MHYFLDRYPYGHEELAVCEDIDQVTVLHLPFCCCCYGIQNFHGCFFTCIFDQFFYSQVRAAMEKYPPYQSIFAKISYGESQMLDKAFYEEEVKRFCLAFEQQACAIILGKPSTLCFS